MPDHDPPAVRDATGDLSLEHGPLREALDAVRAAQDAIEVAKGRLADRRIAFSDTLREQVRARHAAGAVDLASQVTRLLRVAYWEHPELRVSDLATGAGLSQRTVRQIAGPREHVADCNGCGAPTPVVQWSRSQFLSPRCDDCVDHDRAMAEARADPWGEALDSLLHHLEQRLPETGCRNTLAHTQRWALREGRDPAAVMEWARRQGGYCDCELLMNVSLPPDDWVG